MRRPTSPTGDAFPATRNIVSARNVTRVSAADSGRFASESGGTPGAPGRTTGASVVGPDRMPSSPTPDRIEAESLVARLGGVCAVTITFNPRLKDGRLEWQIRDLARQGIRHVLVDNGSRNLAAIREIAARYDQASTPVEVVALEANLGIARALNEGVARGRGSGRAAWILTLDQDTCFPPDAFHLAGIELARIPNFATAGILAFNYREKIFGEERPYNRARGPAEMRSIITSGNFVNARVFDEVHFDDEFFLYFVDVEFCHQLRSRRWKVWVFRNAFIDHQEGREFTRNGRRARFLEPIRLYYVSRNSVRVFRRHGSAKALAVSLYLVMRNCFNGIAPRESLRASFHGACAAVFPERYPPPQLR